MKRDWSLRDELGTWLTHWYVFVLVFLTGGAIGWGSVWVFPSDYESRAPLYVAFNSDALFTSPDDYKNAQFEEATDLMLSNAVLDEILTELDEADRDHLREQIAVQWRNAGRWELVARDHDPDRAAQVAEHWREAAFEQLSTALSHALTFSHLDLEVNLTARKLSDLAQTQTRLEATEMGIRAWLANPDTELVSAEDRAALWAFAEAFSPPNRFPDEGAGRQAYQNWAEGLLAGLEVKRSLLEAENLALQGQMETLREAWQVEKAASRGLSAYLVVELRGEVKVEIVREPGMLALVGGGVAVLGWLGFRLVSVSRRRADDV